MLRRLLEGLVIAFVSAAPYCAGQSAPSPTQPVANLHANADLVVVDVVINDGKDNPIRHLSPTDFAILEDGKPQTVKVL